MLFIPIILIGNALIGINGVIWAMTITEALTFSLGILLFVLSRRALAAAPSAEAEEAAREVEAEVPVVV